MKKNFEIGETVRIHGIDFVVLDAQENSIEVNHDTKLFLLLKEPIGEVCFNTDPEKGNNFCNSVLKDAVAQWFKEFEKNVPHYLLCSRTINLQTLDGQEDYGTMSFRVAPLTLDEFRRYGTVIPECEKSFWLATGMGAPNGTDFRTALSGSGTKRIGMCPVTDRYAIRPAIMVSAQAVDQEKFLQDFSTEELEAELQRRKAVAVCNLIRPLSEFEEKEKTRMSPENYNFEEMVSLCNELKELSCFCELLNLSHEKGYPKELFSHMRYSQNAMNDFLHDHGNAKSLEETKNNIRTAKSAWFAPDFIEYFEKVKAQNAQWYCTGKPILAKTWDKAPVVLPVGCLFEDYIEFLVKEVPGMGGLDADWRMHADGVVGLSLYDLSNETILFRNKDSARAFLENVDLSDMIVNFLVWEGDVANGRWTAWEE